MRRTPVNVLLLMDQGNLQEEVIALLEKKKRNACAYEFVCECLSTSVTAKVHSRLSEKKYSLVIIGDVFSQDLRLDLIRSLTSTYPMIPVLVLSSDTSEKSVVNAIRAGAINYISASDPTRLRDVMEECLNEVDSALEGGFSQITLDLPGLVYQLVQEPDGTLSLPYTNRFIEKFTPVSPDKLKENAAPIFKGILPEDLPGLIDSINESAQHMSLWQRDFRATDPAGETIWIRGISNPSRRPDGAIVWNGIMIDVCNEHQMIDLAETTRQAILNTVIDGIVTIDNKGIIESANKAIETLFGYKEKELLGKNVAVLMPAEFAAHHDGYLLKYKKTGRTHIMNKDRELEGKRKDGSVFPIDLAVSEMIIGEEKKYTGVIRDISQRKEAEQNLVRSEERLRLSHDFAGLITWEWNLETDDLFWSHRFDDQDLSKRKELKVRFDDFLKGVHKEDLDKVMAAIRACIDLGVDYHIEHRAYGKEGQVRWVLERGNVVRDRNGKPLRMIGVAQDISTEKDAEEKLRLSEARLKEAQQLASMGHWVFDFESGELEVSDNIYMMFGIDRVDNSLTAGSFLEAIYREDTETVNTLTNRTLLGEYPQQDIDFRLYLPGGEIRWVHMESTSVFDKTGEVAGLRGIVQDVTERKQVELEMVKAREEAEEARREADSANKAKSRFLSHMSHELRTPMNAILGFTQLLELDKSLDESQAEAVAEIHHASDHLLDLINDVLDLSRIESGKMVLSIKPVRVQSVIDESLSLVESLAEKHAVTIEWNPLDCDGYFMYVDRMRVKEILLNLLSNAIKYNREEGLVAIETGVQGKRIRITITDTGPGIPQDQHDQVFSSFNRLGAEFSDVEGTGIGLVICKRLAEMMGGNIGFSSTPGEGSRFWIDMPLTREYKGALKPEINDTNSSRPKIEVLYVEDSHTGVNLMQQIMLRRPFVHLTSTHDCSTALRLSRRSPPDMILLDMDLTGEAGFKMIQDLRKSETTRPVVVVAISSLELPQNSEGDARQLFNEQMLKPINVRKLLTLVDDLAEARFTQNLGLSEL